MSNTLLPGPTPNTVRAADGKVLASPEGWVSVPPGDAALTRRIRAAGELWVGAEKRGRKTDDSVLSGLGGVLQLERSVR